MEFFDATLKKIVKETSNSYSFIMDIPEGYSWTAGQHVLWKLKDYKVEEGDRDTRVFTIASAPEDGFLMFSTRIGEKHTSFKEILLNQIKPGDIIQVAQPLGTFGFDSDADKTLIIVGGIGITPIRSLLRHDMDAHKAGHKITVLYSDSTGEFAFEKFFKDEAIKKIPDIEFKFLTERNDFTRLTDEYAKANGNSAEYLIAGSPGMNDAFIEQLINAGIDEKNIKKDQFMGY